MHLTKEEEKMLNGEYGEVTERLFRLLVRLGDIYGADKMIPIGSVQVAGVSYKSVGDPGTEFLEDMASKGAKVQVLTYLNPAGMDLVLLVWILKTGKNLVFLQILQKTNCVLWMLLEKWE